MNREIDQTFKVSIGEDLSVDEDYQETSSGLEMLKRFRGRFNKYMADIAVSVGSDHVFITTKHDKEVQAYATFMAVSTSKNEIIAVGEEAAAMRGVEPQGVKAFSVLKHGIPNDAQQFSAYMKRVLEIHFQSKWLAKPRILACGNFSTPLVRHAFEDAFLSLGAREVLLCEPEMASAIGMGLNIAEPDLKSLLVIERDWLAFMVISLSGSVVNLRLNMGPEQMVDDICIFLHETTGFFPKVDDLMRHLRENGMTGKRQLTGWEAWVDEVEKGRPQTITTNEEAYHQAVTPTLLRIKHNVNRCLETLSRDQRWQVKSSPTYLAGSYASIPGQAEMLQQLLGRAVYVSENANIAPCLGLASMLGDLTNLKKSGKIPGIEPQFA